MKAIILAGGYGTRLAEEASSLPKPLVQIGGTPIIGHVLNILASGNINEFIIALGYKGEVIKNHFIEAGDSGTVHQDGACLSVSYSPAPGSSVLQIDLVDTGLETMTGGRLKQLKGKIRKDETFLMTYADGVADIDISRLVEFHKSHGRLATVTAVNPPERFGKILMDDDRVISFNEKPAIASNWINGGFFVLESGVFDYIGSDETVWERGPMEKLVQDGQLMAYRHHGFWSCMDTPSEREYLDSLCTSDRAAWVTSPPGNTVHEIQHP